MALSFAITSAKMCCMPRDTSFTFLIPVLKYAREGRNVQHVKSMGERKHLSPEQESNPWPSRNRSDALKPTEPHALGDLRRTTYAGVVGHLLGLYVTSILPVANVSIPCGEKERQNTDGKVVK